MADGIERKLEELEQKLISFSSKVKEIFAENNKRIEQFFDAWLEEIRNTTTEDEPAEDEIPAGKTADPMEFEASAGEDDKPKPAEEETETVAIQDESSSKEILPRKLINNASDVLDKIQSDSLTEKGSGIDSASPGIEGFAEVLAAGAEVSKIGQCGVDFYLVYLITGKVIAAIKHNDDEQYAWESQADGCACTAYFDAVHVFDEMPSRSLAV